MSESVRQMFASIAGRYDLMNSVLTFGMHHAWRRRAVTLSGARSGQRVLDCASGTGDLAIEFKKAVGAEGEVVATDFCQEMLDFIEPKINSHTFLQKNFRVEVADAMNLPYADNSFDIVSIAYGIRNVDDPRVAIAQMVRVLKNQGCLVVIETGQPKGLMGFFFKMFRPFIPMAGRFIAGNREAYSYLPKTASVFPSGQSFISLLRENRLIAKADAFALFFGVSYIYIAKINK